MHIKAIITAQEVLVRDPMDDDVVSVVEELRRRLPVKVSGQGQGEEESCAEDSEENVAFSRFILAYRSAGRS
ncbi:hypothetical protein QL285_095962 [Trifolium repens]|nr:hypothetical protein QL285_095962 [Trifolium repens]